MRVRVHDISACMFESNDSIHVRVREKLRRAGIDGKQLVESLVLHFPRTSNHQPMLTLKYPYDCNIPSLLPKSFCLLWIFQNVDVVALICDSRWDHLIFKLNPYWNAWSTNIYVLLLVYSLATLNRNTPSQEQIWYKIPTFLIKHLKHHPISSWTSGTNRSDKKSDDKFV